MNNPFYVSRAIAAVLGLLWVHIEPSINFITVCFFALIIDCYTAWRCNRRIYQKYREEIKRNPKCKMDGKLRSKKMAKMVWTFSVLIMCICLVPRPQHPRLHEHPPRQPAHGHVLPGAVCQHTRKREYLQRSGMGKSAAKDCGRQDRATLQRKAERVDEGKEEKEASEETAKE